MKYRSKVIKGKGLGRKLGFPTANLVLDNEKNLPGQGIYAGYVWIRENKYQGAIFYGPVDNLMALEVHILDFNQNLYGEELEIEFVKKIREVIKFNTEEELKNQIAKDCEEVRKILKWTN